MSAELDRGEVRALRARAWVGNRVVLLVLLLAAVISEWVRP